MFDKVLKAPLTIAKTQKQSSKDISKYLLEVNSAIGSQEICLDFKRNHLPDNIMTVFVFL